MVATFPLWLTDIGYLPPHSYALAALRGALLPGDAPLALNILVLAGFAAVTTALGGSLVRAGHPRGRG